MRKDEFKEWLSTRIKKKPISDCMSRCKTVEQALQIDLDEEFSYDKGNRLINKMQYSIADERAKKEAPAEFHFKENANIRFRMTDLRSAVNLSLIHIFSPEANHSEKHYDSDSAFQCGNYRSKSGECVSHYVKTSVLEAAILQAIQAVSKYILENEDEFIQQLKAVWNEQQPRTANNGYGRSAERHHE